MSSHDVGNCGQQRVDALAVLEPADEQHLDVPGPAHGVDGAGPVLDALGDQPDPFGSKRHAVRRLDLFDHRGPAGQEVRRVSVGEALELEQGRDLGIAGGHRCRERRVDGGHGRERGIEPDNEGQAAVDQHGDALGAPVWGLHEIERPMPVDPERLVAKRRRVVPQALGNRDALGPDVGTGDHPVYPDPVLEVDPVQLGPPGQHVDLVAAPAEPGGEPVDDPADPVQRLGGVLHAEEDKVQLVGPGPQGREGDEGLLPIGEPGRRSPEVPPLAPGGVPDVEARRHVALVLLEVGLGEQPLLHVPCDLVAVVLGILGQAGGDLGQRHDPPAVLVRVVRLVLEQHPHVVGRPVLPTDRARERLVVDEPVLDHAHHPPLLDEAVAEVDLVPPVLELLVESTDLDDAMTEERGVGPDGIREHGGARASEEEAQVGAELVLDPDLAEAVGQGIEHLQPGPAPVPNRAARPHGLGVVVGLVEPVQPLRVRICVVIDERDDLAARHRDADVARLGEIERRAMTDLDRARIGTQDLVGRIRRWPAHDDHLKGGVVEVAQRLECQREALGPVVRVDDDREPPRAHRVFLGGDGSGQGGRRRLATDNLDLTGWRDRIGVAHDDVVQAGVDQQLGYHCRREHREPDVGALAPIAERRVTKLLEGENSGDIRPDHGIGVGDHGHQRPARCQERDPVGEQGVFDLLEREPLQEVGGPDLGHRLRIEGKVAGIGQDVDRVKGLPVHIHVAGSGRVRATKVETEVPTGRFQALGWRTLGSDRGSSRRPSWA
jgi:hypothetical protein